MSDITMKTLPLVFILASSLSLTIAAPAQSTADVQSARMSRVSAVLKQNPESDAARAVSFLKSKGYQISDSIMFQRFVRLVDEAKRNEFILLYVEDSGAGRSSAATRTSSEIDKSMQEFRRRALKGFTVLK